DPRPTRAARRQQEAAAPQPPTPPPQWLRALGYGSHDAADFDRVWRQPLTDVMARSFSTPSLAGSRLGSLSTPGAASAPQPAGGAAQQGAPDALDRLLSIEMVRSQPGQLRARITVQPPTKVSQNMADARLRELTDQARAASLVGSELAKQMRRDRCLLPRYGLQVSIKKARSQPRVRSSKSGVSRIGGCPPWSPPRARVPPARPPGRRLAPAPRRALRGSPRSCDGRRRRRSSGSREAGLLEPGRTGAGPGGGVLSELGSALWDRRRVAAAPLRSRRGRCAHPEGGTRTPTCCSRLPLPLPRPPRPPPPPLFFSSSSSSCLLFGSFADPPRPWRAPALAKKRTPLSP
ncbi:unnamed protein product, partial [Prorocentrum cordatum]